MERTTFLEHYRVCVGYDGTRNELGRDGGAVAYEAVDERSSEPVVLTLVPVGGIDPAVRKQFEEQARALQRLRHVNIAKVFDFGREGEDYVYASERLPGETLAAWVAQHGPMPTDATLRVAEQIVSVLSSTGFHKLPYPPVQPQDIIVVPGQTPEGGWPLVKVTNFGLTGLKAGTESSPPGETSPPRVAGELERNEVEVNGQISSAEQSAIAGPRGEHENTGLRSEIYSLGATMYFLLTGIELSAETLRQPPKLSGFPKPLRNLLSQMLHPNPDQRPKDLVVLGEMIRSCLLKIERRLALADRYGIPFRTTIPRPVQPRPRRFLRRALAFGENLTSAPRGKVHWRPCWGSRVFTSACRSPKCCDASGSCDCAIAGGKCGYWVRESTSDGRCGSSQFVSSCVPGSSTSSNIGQPIAGRYDPKRCRGHFAKRSSRKFH